MPRCEINPTVLDIAIVSYRNREMLERTLDGLRANTLVPYSVLLYLNGAEDYLDDEYHERLVAENPLDIRPRATNDGYIEPVNRMVADYLRTIPEVGGPPPFLCLMNDDVELDYGWEMPLISLLIQYQGTLGQVGYGGGLLDGTMRGVERGYGGGVDYIEGWCNMMPLDVVRGVCEQREDGTLLDGRNMRFAYGDDSDLSLVIQESLGLKILAVHPPRMRHLGSQTTTRLGEDERQKLAADFAHNHAYLNLRWADWRDNRRALLRPQNRMGV
jgi:hypothetical protein